MLLMMSEDKINFELLGARVATVNDRLHDLDLRMRSLEIEMREMKVASERLRRGSLGLRSGSPRGHRIRLIPGVLGG
jgi:hypothetical protein